MEKDNCIKVGHFYKLKNNLGLNDFTFFFYYTTTITSIYPSRSISPKNKNYLVFHSQANAEPFKQKGI